MDKVKPEHTECLSHLNIYSPDSETLFLTLETAKQNNLSSRFTFCAALFWRFLNHTLYQSSLGLLGDIGVQTVHDYEHREHVSSKSESWIREQEPQVTYGVNIKLES